MLRALADRGARELVFKEGALPTLGYPDGDKPVSRAALSRAQIVTLISELATTQDCGSLRAGAATRFVYRLDGDHTFAIETRVGESGFTARIVKHSPAPAVARPSAGATPAASAPAPKKQSPSATAPAPTEHSGPKPIDLGNVRSGAPAIEAYLAYMVETGASDLHLSPCETPMLRLHGEMIRVPGAKECSSEEAARTSACRGTPPPADPPGRRCARIP
jgi:hypothetical protein